MINKNSVGRLNSRRQQMKELANLKTEKEKFPKQNSRDKTD
jgi:hypothetical protein